MRTFFNNVSYWGKVVTLGVVLGLGIQFAVAWTNPTSTPPAGNVAGPINTGFLDQVKNGSLGLVGNLVVNMIQINGVATEGAACPSNGLVARDDNGEMLSCHLLTWKKSSGAVEKSETECFLASRNETGNPADLEGMNVCCRIDKQNGDTECKFYQYTEPVSTTWEPFVKIWNTGAPGNYSLSCMDLANNICCRSNTITGSVECKVRTTGKALGPWASMESPW